MTGRIQRVRRAVLTGVTTVLLSSGTVWAASATWNSGWTGGSGTGGLPGAGDDIVVVGGDLAWDSANWTSSVGSWTQGSGYTGTVTFDTTFSGAALNIGGNATVQGGTWTHKDNGTSEAFRLNVAVGGNLELGADAAITATGLGYNQGSGPGAGAWGGRKGAGYGGRGGSANPVDNGGDTYGSITEPVDLGSGGSRGASYLPGGGAVYLTVGGQATIDGTVSANGEAGDSHGGGSGGSIYLKADALLGSGLMQANGADSSSNGGGGGRVAVILTSGADFDDVQTTAYGGLGGTYQNHYRNGGAGTVYLENKDQTGGSGILVLDNNGLQTDGRGYTGVVGSSTDYTQFSSIAVGDGANLGIHDGDTFDFTSGTLTTTNRDDARINITGDSNVTYLSAGGTYQVDAYTLIADGVSAIPGDMTVTADGRVTHSQNYTSNDFGIDFTVAGDLDVQTGGAITADGFGYKNQSGPGVGSWSPARGGSHGGQGGGDSTAPEGVAYGSILEPTAMGSTKPSGGVNWAYGGGTVKITVDGMTTVDGELSSVGWDLTGAGGSIWLTSGELSGSGTIDASGTQWGGGGRVSVQLTSSDTFGSVDIRAYGGPTRNAAGGTVYTEGASDGAGGGTVVIDNFNRDNPYAVTPIPPNYSAGDPEFTFADDISQATFDLVRVARMRVDGDVTIGNLSGDATSYAIIQPGATLTTGGNNDNATMAGTIQGDGNLAKEGTGTFTVDGTYALTGTTQVNEGKLVLNTAASGPFSVADGAVLAVNSTIDASQVSLAPGATLGGTGTLNGGMTVPGGGILSPGNSIGTITMGTGDLTLAANAVYWFEFATDPALSWDTVDLNGNNLVLGSALSLALSLDGPLPDPTDQFVLFANVANAAALSLPTLTFISTTGGKPLVGNVFVDTANLAIVIDNIAVIPEPSTIALLGIGLLALRRRR